MMNSQFEPMRVRQGALLRKEREETPQDFHKGKARMAGDIGERALEMMQVPGEMERVTAWNQAFGESNQGVEFNAGKMRMMEMQQQTAMANAQAAIAKQSEKRDDRRTA